MKSSLFLLAALMAASCLYAQNTDPWPSTGSVGIGTTSPQTLLHVHGSFSVSNPTYTGTLLINHNANNSIIFSHSNIGSFLKIGPGNLVDFDGQQVRSLMRGAQLSTTTGFPALETKAGLVLLNSTSGNTLIGTSTDNGNKLQVHGDISLVAPDVHIRSPRYSILAGDEAGGSYLFYGDNTARPIYIGTAHGNNFHKVYFQKAGQPGDDRAMYNFTYNSATGNAFHIYNAANLQTKLLMTAPGNLILGSTTDNNHKLQVNGTVWATGLVMPTGATAGKVLTSDADGNATWQTAAGGTAGWGFDGNTVPAEKKLGTTSLHALPLITDNTERMRITATGNVGIGTTDPQAKLSVNGDIFSEKVRVIQNVWPDYVFHATYSLRPLREVEKYIQQYRHLPEVPSAKEVAAGGLDLGDTQAILLKKIEELTLYVIAMQKEIEGLKKKMEGNSSAEKVKPKGK